MNGKKLFMPVVTLLSSLRDFFLLWHPVERSRNYGTVISAL